MHVACARSIGLSDGASQAIGIVASRRRVSLSCGCASVCMGLCRHTSHSLSAAREGAWAPRQGSHVATVAGAGFEAMAAPRERRFYLVRDTPVLRRSPRPAWTTRRHLTRCEVACAASKPAGTSLAGSHVAFSGSADDVSVRRYVVERCDAKPVDRGGARGAAEAVPRRGPRRGPSAIAVHLLSRALLEGPCSELLMRAAERLTEVASSGGGQRWRGQDQSIRVAGRQGTPL